MNKFKNIIYKYHFYMIDIYNYIADKLIKNHIINNKFVDFMIYRTELHSCACHLIIDKNFWNESVYKYEQESKKEFDF